MGKERQGTAAPPASPRLTQLAMEQRPRTPPMVAAGSDPSKMEARRQQPLDGVVYRSQQRFRLRYRSAERNFRGRKGGGDGGAGPERLRGVAQPERPPQADTGSLAWPPGRGRPRCA